MRPILSNYVTSITELKKNPTAIIEDSGGLPVAILNHNIPAAYIIPAETYEALLEQIEDNQLAKIVKDRESEIKKAMDVDLDEL